MNKNQRAGLFKCKSGDLAVISRCGEPAYLGLLVRVVAPYKNDDFDWNVRLMGAPVTGRAIYSGRIAQFQHAAVFDWNLTPLAAVEYSRQGNCLEEDPEGYQTLLGSDEGH